MNINLHINKIVLEGLTSESIDKKELERALIERLQSDLMQEQTSYSGAGARKLQTITLSDPGNSNNIGSELGGAIFRSIKA